MKTVECLDLLGTWLDAAGIPAPGSTPLHRCGGAVLGMARAYESDGRAFLRSGDPVNALASAWYGTGWLHFGITYGLLEAGLAVGRPFSCSCESLPPSCAEKLDEKARRYGRLLKTARESVECAGDPATTCGSFSENVLLIASVYAGWGDRHLAENRTEHALACFSYGHGWLDAGVTSGLFRITGNIDLFTV